MCGHHAVNGGAVTNGVQRRLEIMCEPLRGLGGERLAGLVGCGLEPVGERRDTGKCVDPRGP